MKFSAAVSRAVCWVVLTFASLAPDLRAQAAVELPWVGIEAISSYTSEPLPTALVVPGKFNVWRKSSLESALTVYLSYGGTATPDDYESLPEKVVIPAGALSAEFLLLAKTDELVEGTETVVAKIIPPPTSADSIPYEIAPFAAAAEVRIADEDKRPGDLPNVGIRTVRGETTEPSPLSRVAPGEFIVYRDGSASEELDVYLAIEGSATPGVDFEAPDKWVHFAAGASEVKLVIPAYDDSLVEGDETVAIELTIPPTDGLPTYTIDPAASGVKFVIHDNDLEASAKIKITNPQYGAQLPPRIDIEVNAVAVDPESYIPTLEFYLDGKLLDTSVITFIRAPDPGTPVYHSVLWKFPEPGKHELIARGKDSRGVIVSSEPIIVLVGESTPSDTLVSIVTTDIEGTELPITFSSIDPIEFEIARTGPTNGSLVVFFSLHGTASKDDYFEVPTSVIIPDGSASVRLQIVPKADLLKILEPMETVGVRLEPSPVAGPLRTYGIDPARVQAGGVIYEQTPPDSGAVELVFPDRGEGFELGQPIEILAASYLKETAVDFYDGDRKIGSSAVAIDSINLWNLILHSFTWKGATAGEHILTARSTQPDGTQIVSSQFLVVVKDSGVSPAYIKITEPGDGQVFPAPASIPITAVAIDPEGYIARVEFFANNRQIGVSQIEFFRAPDPGTPITHNFLWENVPAGSYVLTVSGLDAHGRAVVSFPIKITVGSGGGGGGSSDARIEIIAPKPGETFEAGTDIPVTAVAIDPKGYIPRVEFYANDRQIGVSEIVFVRAPDPGTPITHTLLWEKVSAGEYTLTARGVDAQGNVLTSSPVKIVVGGTVGVGDQVVVMVEAVDQIASETTESGDPDNAVFVIRRIAGKKDVDVPVMFKLSGTAVNGVDYSELKDQTVIPAGADSVEVVVKPIPDKAIESDETVELHLIEPVCPAIFPPPPQCYLIGKVGAARVLIRDYSTSSDELFPKVAIVPPSDGSKVERGQPLEIRTDAAVKGKSCLLETSTDLKTWTSVSPVFLPDGQLTYVTETGTENQRYYRLKVQ